MIKQPEHFSGYSIVPDFWPEGCGFESCTGQVHFDIKCHSPLLLNIHTSTAAIVLSCLHHISICFRQKLWHVYMCLYIKIICLAAWSTSAEVTRFQTHQYSLMSPDQMIDSTLISVFPSVRPYVCPQTLNLPLTFVLYKVQHPSFLWIIFGSSKFQYRQCWSLCDLDLIPVTLRWHAWCYTNTWFFCLEQATMRRT